MTQYIHGTAPDEQARLAALNRLTNAPFLEFLGPSILRSGARLLEVGSGLGLLAREVATRAGADALVTGLEYSEDQLRVARLDAPANVRFVQGDAHALSFESASFDASYCRYVLEHVADPRKVLSEMRRVTKPGGAVCVQENNILIHVTDPGCPAFEVVWKKFAALQKMLGGDAEVGQRLFSLFKEAGFSKVELSLAPEVHWQGSSGFVTWIDNIIGNVKSGAAGLEERGLASAPEIAQAISELETIKCAPNASVVFYWNRARAVR